MNLKTIAVMHTDFPEKFGIPRQSGVVENLKGTIVFEPAYRNPDALRGLEGFSHIWVIWGFSQAVREEWSPTVRPPRLGGNARVGVFASRSPFRPNALGLSSLAVESIEQHPALGPVIHVLGADLMDGTPIYDIKPYLPYVDCRPEAKGGYAGQAPQPRLRVVAPEELLALLPEEKRGTLLDVLALDPRPSYQEGGEKLYGMAFAGVEVKFAVAGDVLTVQKIEKRETGAQL